MSRRYDALFARLAEAGEGAFVPFLMLGDPTPGICLEIVRTLVDAGADALELGLPFSDPVADGPTIQASHVRALRSGTDVESALALIRSIRAEFPELPIGMLIYGSVAFSRGIGAFYEEFGPRGADVDSILLPDVPVRECAPFTAAAEAAGVDPVLIAPPRASERTLAAVAAGSRGYIYAISRDGVTGTEKGAQTSGLSDAVEAVRRFRGAPVLLGFGISSPEQVAAAIAAGASGAICGSAITRIIASRLVEEEGAAPRVDDLDALKEELRAFVSGMKDATRRGAGNAGSALARGLR